MTNTDKEVMDILKSFMSDDEIKDAILKGNIKLGIGDEIEKGCGGMKEEGKEKVSEGEEKKEGKEKKEKEGKETEEKIEKSEKKTEIKEDLNKSKENEFFKSIENKFSEIDDLKKSVGDLTNMLSSMNETINKFSNTPAVPKSVKNFQYLEKGKMLKDDEDRFILSVSKNREELGEIMLKSLKEEKNDLMKSQIESDLMNVIAGNGIPSKEVSKYFYENKNIRITK